ncbi:MAG: hypothetical protein QF535_06745 [Anaerolineales bacterium]|nr:hypothetical protein [Anaerolineales bacterium]
MVGLLQVLLETAPVRVNQVMKVKTVKLLKGVQLEQMEMFARTMELLLEVREDVDVFVR